MNPCTLSLALLCASGAVPPEGESADAPEAPHFAPPVLLTGGEKPLGRGLLYPSPTLFDVDGDGADELIMGDLWGTLHVAERTPAKGPHAWSTPQPLKDADGNDLDFSNW